MKVRVSDIRISNNFKKTIPSLEKMEKCRQYFQENGKIDAPIIVNENMRLLDGYIRYLILVENNVEEIDVEIKAKKVTYVFGRHSMYRKEYVWRITKETKNRRKLGIGAFALVSTKDGFKVVKITRVEKLANPPIDIPIKRVVKCF